MLIPKNKKTAEVENPFRPKIGVPRSYSVCKVSWGTFQVEANECVERLMVDADDNASFVSIMETTIPIEDRHRCTDHEFWLIDKNWKKFIVDTAKEYFDETVIQLRKW